MDGLNTKPQLSGFGVQFCDAGRAAGGGRLRGGNLIDSVKWAGPFSSHGPAEQAARALAKAAELYSHILEAMLALRGKGAAVAATRLKPVERVTYSPLEGIHGHGLRIVSHYKQQGMVSAKSSSMPQEATRPASAGNAVYMPLARTVIGNQGIERS